MFFFHQACGLWFYIFAHSFPRGKSASVTSYILNIPSGQLDIPLKSLSSSYLITGQLDMWDNPPHRASRTDTDTQISNKHPTVVGINRSFHEFLRMADYSTRGWNNQPSNLVYNSESFLFHVLVYGDWSVCCRRKACLCWPWPAVFFWFDPQRKQLAVEFWIPAALTMNCLYDAVRKALARW